MTTLIQPFRGLRPVPERAADVAAPPYDVLNTAEARTRAEGRPLSFLHISKPEIDLPEDTDPYADEEPKLVITADNYREHVANLAEGQIALFERYPHFKMYVYPTHRDFGVQERIAKKTAWNAATSANTIRIE